MKRNYHLTVYFKDSFGMKFISFYYGAYDTRHAIFLLKDQFMRMLPERVYKFQLVSVDNHVSKEK